MSSQIWFTGFLILAVPVDNYCQDISASSHCSLDLDNARQKPYGDLFHLYLYQLGLHMCYFSQTAAKRQAKT